MSKLQNLQKALGIKVEEKAIPKEDVKTLSPVQLHVAFEMPCVLRVAPGKYDLRMVAIDPTKLPEGRLVEQGQSLGVIKAALAIALRKSSDKYIHELLK